MKKYIFPIILVAVLFAAVIGYFIFSSMEHSVSRETPIISAAKNGFQYRNYDEKVLAQAKSHSPYALFFHAPWCPTCRGIENGLIKNPDLFPPDTLVFKVDYDTETKLKEKYGVTLQSTVVILDTHENVVQKLVSPKVNDIADGLASLSVENPS